MAAVFVNDLSGNPLLLAEVGPATTKNWKVAEFRYCEPDSAGHVADLSDGHGRPILRLDDANRWARFSGWVNGITVDRLDSGYVVVSLITD